MIMEVVVNNKTISIPHNYTLKELLEYLNYTRSVAVFINGKQILMAEYDNYALNQNDNIRIIKPLGGG